MLFSWLADKILKIYYIRKNNLEFSRKSSSSQLGRFRAKRQTVGLSVLWTRGKELELGVKVCLSNTHETLKQQYISYSNSLVFQWLQFGIYTDGYKIFRILEQLVGLYLRSVTPIYIQDGTGSVRQRYTSLSGPYSFTRFQSGAMVLQTSILFRNILIGFRNVTDICFNGTMYQMKWKKINHHCSRIKFTFYKGILVLI